LIVTISVDLYIIHNYFILRLLSSFKITRY